MFSFFPIVPLGADALVGCYIDGVCDGLVPNRQAEIGNSTRAVFLHQNVLGLEIPVSDARLTCRKTSPYRYVKIEVFDFVVNSHLQYKHPHPECPGSPCADVPVRWQPTEPV